MPFTDQQIARVVHDANRALCIELGDTSHVDWDNAPDWQRDSVLEGVALYRVQPNLTPQQSHEAWVTKKLNDGWKLGPVKDEDKKEHPCIIPYEQLDPGQKQKDFLIRDICRSFFHSGV